jgi:hypothetical protein
LKPSAPIPLTAQLRLSEIIQGNINMLSRLFNLVAVLAATVAITACGGGGGGGSGGGGAPASFIPIDNKTTTTVVTTTPSVTPTTVTISGTATFQSLSNISTSNSGLNYAAPVVKPIRGVTVQALSDIGNILASTTTSDTGSYTLQFTTNSNYQLIVRSELVKTQGNATWDVRLKDNTNNNNPWVVTVGGSTAPAATATRNITALSGWNAATGSYTGARAAGLFAILDTIYESMRVVSAAQTTINFPLVSVYWSENNTSASGSNLSLGQIGTSFFRASLNSSGAVTARDIYILGKADNDTDEFDSSVIAHEYGHYLQSAFSTNTALGGDHTFNDKLDMTIAFSEGWGNGFSSIVRNTSTYADSVGSAQSSGRPFNFTLPTDADRGWYREDTVTALLYSFSSNSNGGFAKIWAAVSGPMKTAQDSLATIFSFADAVRSANNTAANTALNTLLAGQNIVATSTDQWGASEANDGGNINNLPLYTTLTFNTAQQACFVTINKPTYSDEPNKLGMVRYYRINLTSAQAGARTVTAQFTAGRDLDFDVYQRGILIVSAGGTSNATTSSEAKTATLASGEVVIRVRDYDVTTPPIAPNCGTIKIN